MAEDGIPEILGLVLHANSGQRIISDGGKRVSSRSDRRDEDCDEDCGRRSRQLSCGYPLIKTISPEMAIRL
jgi:hypothetical protein